MNKKLKIAEQISTLVADIHEEIQPALYQNAPEITEIPPETEQDLNAKIMKITLEIQEQYPELSKYLEEMPITIPDEKNPEITRKNLGAYYDSLKTVLDKYILEHNIIQIK